MPDMTAAQLIFARLCAAQCLLAGAPSDICDCACGGRWHGALGQVRVPETAAHRTPLPAPQPGPHLIDELEASRC